VDREERDIIESIAAELHGIRKALEALVAIATAPEEEDEAKPQPVIMDMGLDALFVSRRAENSLRRAGCRTVTDVARKSAHQLLCTRGVGVGVLQEVRRAMVRLGLKLAGD
jgi:DNA-directed RNA polymerase alpha subunit